MYAERRAAEEDEKEYEEATKRFEEIMENRFRVLRNRLLELKIAYYEQLTKHLQKDANS